MTMISGALVRKMGVNGYRGDEFCVDEMAEMCY